MTDSRKVFVVTEGQYSDAYVSAVYDDENLAIAHVASVKAGDGSCFYREYSVNVWDDAPERRRVHLCQMDTESGDCEMIEVDFAAPKNASRGTYEGDTLFRTTTVYGWSEESAEEAMKLAAEARQARARNVAAMHERWRRYDEQRAAYTNAVLATLTTSHPGTSDSPTSP